MSTPTIIKFTTAGKRLVCPVCGKWLTTSVGFRDHFRASHPHESQHWYESDLMEFDYLNKKAGPK